MYIYKGQGVLVLVVVRATLTLASVHGRCLLHVHVLLLVYAIKGGC